jgi:hypothetical protein
MRHAFRVLGGLGISALALGCSDGDAADGARGGAAGAMPQAGQNAVGGAPGSAGTTTTPGGTSAGTPPGGTSAGTPPGGSSVGGAPAAGGNAAQAGGAGRAPEAPLDCSTAPADECPFATGITFACKKRFALGINYAWRNFGADFGGLAAWSIQGVAAAPADYLADLKEMKAAGASVIRWWVFPDFRGDGVQFDASDDPTGLSPSAIADMKQALALAEQADVYLVPTIFSFDAFRAKHTSEGVTIRGISQLVTTPARRAKLIANVVEPLAHAAATSDHVTRLIGWDIVNEPEWAIEPTGQSSQDFSPNDELDPVPLTDMKALIAESRAVLARETPAAFTSVGFAAAKWAWAFADVELDVNQPHIYGWVNTYWPYTLTADKLGYPANRPTIMGEFFLQSMPFADGGDNVAFEQILSTLWAGGYAGAWPWQHFDQTANLPLLESFATAKGCQATF